MATPSIGPIFVKFSTILLASCSIFVQLLYFSSTFIDPFTCFSNSTDLIFGVVSVVGVKFVSSLDYSLVKSFAAMLAVAPSIAWCVIIFFNYSNVGVNFFLSCDGFSTPTALFFSAYDAEIIFSSDIFVDIAALCSLCRVAPDGSAHEKV